MHCIIIENKVITKSAKLFEISEINVKSTEIS